MSAYVIVDANPVDAEKLTRYSAAAAETLAPFGGKFLAKGPIESLHGETPFPNKVIIEFPDRESAFGWYSSDAYQAIVDLRNQGMTSQFHLTG